MPERAVVTGAAGFIGSTLALRLAADGVDVVGVDAFLDTGASARPERLRRLDAAGVRVVRADLRTYELEPLLDGAGVVYHCAGRAGVRESWRDFRAYTEHNLVATDALLRAAARAGVPRVVHSSSSSVYGSSAQESVPRIAPATPYAVSKYAAEQLCAAHADGGPFSVVVLRYFTVYGPGQRHDMAFHRFVTAAAAGRPVMVLGDGSQQRDFTYVGDAVEANVRAGRAAVRGTAVVDVGPGTPRRLDDALDVLGRCLGRPVEVVHGAPGRGEATLTRADVAGTRTLLGWSPTVTLEEGLQRQVDHQLSRVGGHEVQGVGAV